MGMFSEIAKEGAAQSILMQVLKSYWFKKQSLEEKREYLAMFLPILDKEVVSNEPYEWVKDIFLYYNETTEALSKVIMAR